MGDAIISMSFAGGMVSALLYVIIVFVVHLGMFAYHWLTDGDYEFYNPIIKTCMRIRRYTPDTGIYNIGYIQKGTLNKNDGSKGVSGPFMIFCLVPGLIATAIVYWYISLSIVAVIGLAYTSRFTIRLNKKLDKHIKEDH